MSNGAVVVGGRRARAATGDSAARRSSRESARSSGDSASAAPAGTLVPAGEPRRTRTSRVLGLQPIPVAAERDHSQNSGAQPP